ncbi:MAG: putative DNA binding domain-containing protein [Lachnospiraceae bacterium]|nr:putative DNA binding domain-containing protein [Lachnospiraceae bacterium]
MRDGFAFPLKTGVITLNLYFGVDDSGFVKGQQNSDSTKRDISRKISESIEPRIVPTIESLTIEQRTIIKVSCLS